MLGLTVPDKLLVAADEVDRIGHHNRAEGVLVARAISSPTSRQRSEFQTARHWLDYDPVALAVLVIGIGMIELLAWGIWLLAEWYAPP